MTWQHPEISDAIRRALAEDIGSGDVTTEACIPEDLRAQGVFVAQEDLVVASVEILPEIYEQEQVDVVHHSGDRVEAGAVIGHVSGSARRLLTLERTALNFLQRLSGIATLARRFAEAVEGTGCEVLDTRKTSPGLRRLEKLAAQAGGVTNHRMGLFDAILIKNNHIVLAGGVKATLERVQNKGMPVEIEVRNLAELEEALVNGADHLLLDNFSVEQVREGSGKIAGRAQVEASGGVTLENVRAYADAGVDYVSSGAITHSARAVDISFRIETQ